MLALVIISTIMLLLAMQNSKLEEIRRKVAWRAPVVYINGFRREKEAGGSHVQ